MSRVPTFFIVAVVLFLFWFGGALAPPPPYTVVLESCDLLVDPDFIAEGEGRGEGEGGVVSRELLTRVSSLHAAVSSVRNMRQRPQSASLSTAPANRTYKICLSPAVHSLSTPLVLGPEDRNLHFAGLFDGAVVSGGITIGGFAQCTGSTTLWCANVSAIDSPLLQSRHLYMNGLRLSRTRASDSVVQALAKPLAVNDDGYVVQSDSGVLDWHKSGGAPDVELVFTSPDPSPWTESRCTLLNVTANPKDPSQAFVFVKNPCFYVLRNKPCGQGTDAPTSIENTGVRDLTAPGSWYLDRASSTLFVFPPISEETPAELMSTATITMPILETLVHAVSSSGISFSGISFEYATWLASSRAHGYVEQQSGARVFAPDGSCDPSLWVPMPSNLRFESTQGVVIRNCTFQHLGGGALQFRGGAQNSSVEGCVFTDVSGTAVQIGDYNTSKLRDPTRQDLFNSVSDSLIAEVAVEYHGCCGLQVGYSAFTSLTHLEIRDLSYGGICIGWGWAREPDSYASNNTISFNYIHNIKRLLGDGGGIYALGPQPGSLMHDNWVSAMASGRGGGAYYPDEGSAYWTITNNVFSNASICTDSCEWLHIWTASIHDVAVGPSWTDTDVMENHGSNCTVNGTVVVKPGSPWPSEALSIMHNAGPRELSVERTYLTHVLTLPPERVCL